MKKLDKNGYAPSILQADPERCFLCGRHRLAAKLDRHEVFGGANRDKAKADGLWVLLCHDQCHLYGAFAVHRNAETAEALHHLGQRTWQLTYNKTTNDFITAYGRNYL